VLFSLAFHCISCCDNNLFYGFLHLPQSSCYHQHFEFSNKSYIFIVKITFKSNLEMLEEQNYTFARNLQTESYKTEENKKNFLKSRIKSFHTRKCINQHPSSHHF